MQTKTYLIVSFIGQKVQKIFSESQFPFHLTIIRPFETSVPEQSLLAAIKDVASRYGLIESVVLKKDLFGPKSDVPVMLVNCTDELQNLHQELTKILKSKVIFKEPFYDPFQPHISDQRGRGFNAGQEVSISSIALVEIDATVRKIIGDNIRLRK